MTKVRVIKLDVHQGTSIGDQGFVIDKVYETEHSVDCYGNIAVFDEYNSPSALFAGEFEVTE